MSAINSRRIFALLCFFFALGTLVSAATCTTCPAGQYCDGNNGCKPCRSGTFSIGGTNPTCQACAPGYVSGQGAAQCTACPAGSYPNNEKSQCQLASAGYYVPTAGSPDQTPCPKGYYSPTSGSTSCTICPCSTFNFRTGASTCDPCGNRNGFVTTSPAGSTSSDACQPVSPGGFIDSSKCPQTCPSGTISTTTNANSCTACSSNQIAPPGSTACTTCGTGTAPNPSKSSCTPTSTGGWKKRQLPKCANGHQYCPANGSRRGVFECIDTMNNLQSCGGCWSTGAGQDCTDFDNLATASCVHGKCEYSCPNGYKLTDLGCIKAAPSSSRNQKNLGKGF